MLLKKIKIPIPESHRISKQIFEIFKFHLLPTVDYVCFHVTVPAGIVFAVVLLHSPEAVFAAHGAAVLAGGQPQPAFQHLGDLTLRHVGGVACGQICLDLDHFAVMQVIRTHILNGQLGCLAKGFRCARCVDAD